jgi:putative zinc finger/helix-turn-helix YgiT family protein
MSLVLEGSLHRRCGGHYALATETVTLRVSGMAATVERGLFRCSACGDEHRTVEQREAAEQAAIAVVRTRHGLLLPKEIRQLRERLGVSTEQLGDLLYGVPRSVIEGWERGRYVQNPEVDALLRSLDDREVLERRAARAGVALPVPELPLDVPRAPLADAPVSAALPAPMAPTETPTSIPVVAAADAPFTDTDHGRPRGRAVPDDVAVRARDEAPRA